MKIIISPAKAMAVRQECFQWKDMPVFADKTKRILSKLKSMDYDALKALWKCNDEIAKLNTQRLARFELDRELSPAISAYDGIQYQNIKPEDFDRSDIEYIQGQLRILSGFYGVLKPLDGVRPYRLEMQAKLSVDGKKDLYDFWGNMIADEILKDTDCVINLASREYSRCVSKYLNDDTRFITCVFGEEKDGRLIEKGTMCKIARGEMVRWLTKNKIENPEDILNFEGTHHRYSPEFSDKNTYSFIKK